MSIAIPFFLVLTVAIVNLNANQTLDVAEYLKSKCNVAPNVNFPGELTGDTAAITMAITPLQLLGINDVSETFTMAVSIALSWHDACTVNALKSEDFIFRNYSIFYFKKDTFWSPKLIHLNSKVFKSTESDDFERGIRIWYGNYATYTYGVFQSHCDLDLRTFPFDQYDICSNNLLKFVFIFLSFLGSLVTFIS